MLTLKFSLGLMAKARHSTNKLEFWLALLTKYRFTHQSCSKGYLPSFFLHLNGEQFDRIRSIAEQCRLEGGKVVYRARALYQLVEQRQFIDEDICISVQALQAATSDDLPFESVRLDQTSKKQSIGQIKVYPNPTKQFLQIELPDALAGQQIELELMNMHGQLMQRWFSSNALNRRLDIKNIPAGIYWLNISSNGENYLNSRIVILP